MGQARVFWRGWGRGKRAARFFARSFTIFPVVGASGGEVTLRERGYSNPRQHCGLNKAPARAPSLRLASQAEQLASQALSAFDLSFSRRCFWGHLTRSEEPEVTWMSPPT